MSGIVDPSTPEREVVEDVAARLCVFGWSIDGMNDLDDVERQRVNDLAGWVMRDRAAVRARALADVAGWVEGMDGYPVRTEADEFYGRDGIETVDRDSLLAKLREAK